MKGEKILEPGSVVINKSCSLSMTLSCSKMLKCQQLIFDILTFINRMHTSLEYLKQENSLFFLNFSFHEQLKLHAELSKKKVLLLVCWRQDLKLLLK